jgi:hypothetical protein
VPDGGYPDIVTVRQFLKCGAVRAPSGGLFPLPSHVLSLGLSAAPAFGGAGADKVAARLANWGIKSLACGCGPAAITSLFAVAQWDFSELLQSRGLYQKL